MKAEKPDHWNISWPIIILLAAALALGACGEELSEERVKQLTGGGGSVPTGSFTVTPSAGLLTNEGLGTATFTVVLNALPTANVNIGLSSSNPAEGTVSPSTLTFTPGDWNLPQTVTVTGVDDGLADGSQSYAVVTAPATSADQDYNGADPPDVSVVNVDDEGAGITVAPISGLVTSEAGGPAGFNVVLNTQPINTVTIGLSSNNTAEGTVSPSSLIFTSVNWSSPQPVTVTGVNDLVDDGNRAYSVLTAPAVSTDPVYSGLNPADVGLTNVDNETTFTLNHINRGNYSDAGVGSGGFSDTFTGWNLVNEFNSYFAFSLAGITGTVLTASLNTEVMTYLSGAGSESFSIWDVTTPPAILNAGAGGLPAFADLQSGINYGSFTVFLGTVGVLPPIPLNANAVSGIQANLGSTFFAVGFTGITLSKFFLSTEGVRYSLAAEARTHQLVLLVEQ